MKTQLPERVRFYLPVEENPAGRTHLEVTAFYKKAGMNYFTYKHEDGGFYVSMSPVEINDGSVRSTMGEGRKLLVEPAKRMDRKKVSQYADTAKQHINQQSGELWLMCKTLCEEYGLTLKKE